MSKKKSKHRAQPKAPAVLQERVRDLQKRIRSWKVPAMLVTNHLDIKYLTGFCGEDSWAIVPARGNTVHVLTDFRFIDEIAADAPHVKALIRDGSLIDAAAKIREKHNLRRFAIQPGYINLNLKKALDKKLGVRACKPVKDGMLQQRAIKTPGEVKLLTKAGEIQQHAMRKLLPMIKPGMTELAIMSLLHYEMGKLGASGPAFSTIVGADANAAKCHHRPGLTKVKKNGIVLIDWGALYQGYHSDMTRTYALGKMPAKIQEIYKIVLDAQLAAIDRVKPGVPLKDLDKAAREIIDKAGYGKEYGHGLGHGIGLDVHEQPGIGKKSKGVLEPGQVITIEPGIYLSGIGGVRIEDDVLVTARGKRVLTDSLPKSLESAII